jgi:CheY-like chemotaxis protein
MPPDLDVTPILLVEDNPGDVILIREMLAEHGLRGELKVIADGDLACEFIARLDRDSKIQCPGLLILDLNLPRRSGCEVLKTLRESDRCGRIPVAILSSSSAPKDRDAVTALGADTYIQKPISLEEFMQIGAILKQVLLSRRDR